MAKWHVEMLTTDTEQDKTYAVLASVAVGRLGVAGESEGEAGGSMNEGKARQSAAAARGPAAAARGLAAGAAEAGACREAKDEVEAGRAGRSIVVKEIGVRSVKGTCVS